MHKKISYYNIHPLPPKDIDKIISVFKNEQHIKRYSKENRITIQRNKITKTPKIDPILFLPCTTEEQIRLVKWRLGWLPPPFSVGKCICGFENTKLNHYLTTCPNTTILIEYLDHLIKKYILPSFTTPTYPLNIIDYLLNILPSNINNIKNTHWFYTWPILHKVLYTIEISYNPNVKITAEPNHGEAFIKNMSKPKPIDIFNQ
jgi:hypothetical protein